MGIKSIFQKVKENCRLERSLTEVFLEDFKHVMASHVIGVADNPFTSPLPARDGRFRLEEVTSTGALLKSAAGASVFIQGYYVHAEPNNKNPYTLPTGNNEPYYMFTVPLTGCQFIAYGLLDNLNVNVEHNNFTDDQDPAERYANRLKEIEDEAPGYLFSISPGNITW